MYKWSISKDIVKEIFYPLNNNAILIFGRIRDWIWPAR